MKKIGIVTHYYKNVNFGGNLQAYALCKFLNERGYSAEQISFTFMEGGTQKTAEKSIFGKIKEKGFFGCMKWGCALVQKPFAKFKKVNRYKRKYSLRQRRLKAIEHFNDKLIPHSEKVYTAQEIQSSVNDYDVFITGSDQVWNMSWYKPAFFLDFVPSHKTKLSYGASLGKTQLTPEQKEIFKKNLSDFKGISVREKSAIGALEDVTNSKVQHVCDPVLLLEREDWDKVCADRIVKEKYVFCYFLGRNKAERKIAEKYAKQKGLKLVTIPYANGYDVHVKDFNKKNIRMFDSGPQEFLSLIKHAQYVFTDSFHAVVFSYIYQKQYFVFNRDKTASMSTRITDVTALLDTEERFCVGKERENLQYVLGLKDIDYAKENREIEKLRKDSIDFLEENLK